MLRRLPLAFGTIFCSWALLSGCEATGSTLQTGTPMAYGGAVSNGGTNASTFGGNSYLQGGSNVGQGGVVGQGGSNVVTGGAASTAKGGAATGGAVTGNGGAATGGAASTAKGGAATGGAVTGNGGAATGGAVTGNGGATTVGNGGATTVGNGGATTVGNGGGSSVAQTCTTDLMTLRIGTTNDWIPNSTGNSCGVQGAIFGYSDGSSCTIPATGICTAGATGTCCISGTTVVDATSAKWGCGIGMDLNSSGGTVATKGTYSGTAKGFKFTLTGTFPTGATLRIMYAATTTVQTTDPFKEIPAAAGTYTVLFSEVTCPTTWGATATCTAASATPYQFKVQLVGGGSVATAVGAFNYCISSILPA
jgi:hypothetical protein